MASDGGGLRIEDDVDDGASERSQLSAALPEMARGHFLRAKFNREFREDEGLAEEMDLNETALDNLTEELQDADCTLTAEEADRFEKDQAWRLEATGCLGLRKAKWTVPETNVLVGLHRLAVADCPSSELPFQWRRRRAEAALPMPIFLYSAQLLEKHFSLGLASFSDAERGRPEGPLA